MRGLPVDSVLRCLVYVASPRALLLLLNNRARRVRCPIIVWPNMLRLRVRYKWLVISLGALPPCVCNRRLRCAYMFLSSLSRMCLVGTVRTRNLTLASRLKNGRPQKGTLMHRCGLKHCIGLGSVRA